MSEIVHMLEAVNLHVERRDGWLANVIAAIDGRRFRLESFVLHGAAAGGLMEVTLIVRACSATPDDLLQSLQAIAGVRFARLLPPWRRLRGGKALAMAEGHVQIRRRVRPGKTALAAVN